MTSQSTETSTPPRQGHYISQSLRLSYVSWGDPGAPPLILQHGGFDHCRSWDRVAQALADRYHVIAADMRGHGDSQWSAERNYIFDTHVEDFAELVRHLDAGPVSIIAHSYGGRVALRYAGLYPEMVSKLVAIEGLLPSPTTMEKLRAIPIDKRIRTYRDQVRALSVKGHRPYLDIEQAAARMRERNPRLAPELALHLATHGTHRLEDGSYVWKFDQVVGSLFPSDVSPEDERYLFGRIGCPVLLINGLESEFAAPADDFRIPLIADARVADFAAAGHWVQHDRFDEFMAATEAFLAASA